jgi:hypothetical protein
MFVMMLQVGLSAHEREEDFTQSTKVYYTVYNVVKHTANCLWHYSELGLQLVNQSTSAYSDSSLSTQHSFVTVALSTTVVEASSYVPSMIGIC